MKRILVNKLLAALLGIFISASVFAQLQVQGGSVGTGNINAENPFLDVSSSYDLSLDASSAGKGLVFPRADLTTWSFETANLYAGSAFFPSFFNGMIVYNTGTGNTPTTQVSTSTAVTPGFYYFSNPAGADDYDIANGKWIRITDGTDSSSGGSGESNATAYYGMLATTDPAGSDITTGLTAVTLSSGLYQDACDMTLSGDGYYTVALPVSWRNPSLTIDGDETFNIFLPLKILDIEGTSYQVWQTDVSVSSGDVMAIR